MTRLLILLITLNAIFPATGYTMAYAPGSHQVINVSQQASTEKARQQVTDKQATNISCHHMQPMSSMQGKHCDMPCCQHSAHPVCGDGGCHANCHCLGISATILSSALPELTPNTPTLAPVSGYTSLFNRTISPELHPPLV